MYCQRTRTVFSTGAVGTVAARYGVLTLRWIHGCIAAAAADIGCTTVGGLNLAALAGNPCLYI